MNGIMDLLESRELEVEFRWLDKNTHGIIDVEKHSIIIDLDLLLAEVLIHENIHHHHPELNEAEVHLRTICKTKRLKKSEIRLIGKKLMDLWSTREKNKDPLEGPF